MANGLIDFGTLRPNAAMESYQQGQQNQLAQMQLGQQQQAIRDAEAEREAYKTAGNDYAKLEQEFFNRGLGKQGMAINAARAKQQSDRVAMLKGTTELLESTAKSIFNNPATAEQRLLQFGKQTGHNIEQDLAELRSYGGDEAKIKSWAAGHAFKAADLLPKFQQFDTPGGGKQIGAVDPLTAKFTAATTMAPQMTPGERAVDARAREREARLAAGGDLKPVPVHAQKAITGAASALGKIDAAIAALEANPDAVGWKGYAPDALLNRNDPEGTVARAKLADIGSLKIHERSGAAVTASETPRLKPFIPSISDDYETALKKLKDMRDLQAAEQEVLTGTYNREQGFRDFSAPQPTGKPPAAASNTPAAAQKGKLSAAEQAELDQLRARFKK